MTTKTKKPAFYVNIDGTLRTLDNSPVVQAKIDRAKKTIEDKETLAMVLETLRAELSSAQKTGITLAMQSPTEANENGVYDKMTLTFPAGSPEAKALGYSRCVREQFPVWLALFGHNAIGKDRPANSGLVDFIRQSITAELVRQSAD